MHTQDLPDLPPGFHLGGPALRFSFTPHGALRRADAGEVMLNLFLGNALDGGPANLWLRRREGGSVPLLGPRSPLSWQAQGDTLQGDGAWQGLVVRLQLRVAEAEAAWCWHLEVHNTEGECVVDVVHAQDLGLAPSGAIRLNEYYVSHYLDFTPLAHADHGTLLAVRQNQPAGGRHPWLLLGTLGRCSGWATDGRQVFGAALRDGLPPPAAREDLPSQRLQHEHAMAALQAEAQALAPGGTARFGFFALFETDHPAASGPADLRRVPALRALPQAQASWLPPPAASPVAASCFTLPPLACREAGEAELDAWCGPERRHAERDGQGRLLSFFHGEHAHVVLPAKERQLTRPHGHLLRTGVQQVPDEAALTSTAWMGGVFHSMLTQGHVNVNRLLSCARSALALFPSQGLRAFVRRGGRWQLLGLPSAFEMQPGRCRWWYADGDGVLQVSAGCDGAAHRLSLAFDVLQGEPCELLLSLRIALAGDDGSAARPVAWRPEGDRLCLPMPPGSELAARFPQGEFVLTPQPAPRAVGGDELVHADGGTQREPLLCLQMPALRHATLQLEGRLVDAAPVQPAGALVLPQPQGAAPAVLQRIGEALPWFLHDALVHYLAPRGLEQFSGGGWGTRDVCQGPLELLLALDAPAAARDLLQRVFSAQDAGGDWPQWFMFFERDRHVRAGDSHGDIVFWPLLALARYLLASGDAVLLDAPLPYHDAAPEPLIAHVQRALAVIAGRRIAGTALAAYGHGDWNDSLQPADPALRERLCSAWTVTLHHQVLTQLSRALQVCGHDALALPLQAEATAVLADFRRLLLRDGVVAGYARFDGGGAPTLLLHPSDPETGLSYSLLPMMHAVLEDMLTPEEAQAQLALIREHLSGPDGVRLFDRPLAYRGGPQRLFQRAESSSFFGREVGLMYTHAHLRWAQALAHVGDGAGLVQALDLAHPVALRERLAMADLRQANCYYSSSDAAFADRYEAARRYADVAAGRVALDGGWRVYSSGPGLFVAIVVRDLLGLRREADTLVLDPVLPSGFDGLALRWSVAGLDLVLRYRVGTVGCGPVRLWWNGRPLAFTTAPHRHRRGPARVALPTLQASALPGPNELGIELP